MSVWTGVSTLALAGMQRLFGTIYARPRRDGRWTVISERCPFCAARSTTKGNPALNFCDKHYRQYLATFQISPKDLAAYREKAITRTALEQSPKD